LEESLLSALFVNLDIWLEVLHFSPDIFGGPFPFSVFADVANISAREVLSDFTKLFQLVFWQLFSIALEDLGSGRGIRDVEPNAHIDSRNQSGVKVSLPISSADY